MSGFAIDDRSGQARGQCSCIGVICDITRPFVARFCPSRSRGLSPEMTRCPNDTLLNLDIMELFFQRDPIDSYTILEAGHFVVLLTDKSRLAAALRSRAGSFWHTKPADINLGTDQRKRRDT